MKTKEFIFLIISLITAASFSQTKEGEKVNWIECIGTEVTEFGGFCLATGKNNARAYLINNCTEKVKVWFEFTGPCYDNSKSCDKTKTITLAGNSKKRVSFCNVKENNGSIRVTKVESDGKNSSSTSKNEEKEKTEDESETPVYRKSSCTYLAEVREDLKNAEFRGQADIAKKEIARLTPLCNREKEKATYTSDKLLRGSSSYSNSQRRRNQNQQTINRAIADHQRRMESLDREASTLLNTWQNTMQTEYDLYSQEYDSYENFKSRTANLSSLNASSYSELTSEFKTKMSQLDREYSSREREVNQQITNRFNASKTGTYDALNDLAAHLHQQQAEKNLKKEKRQAQLKLRREKEKKMEVFVQGFKTEVDQDKIKAFERAKYAISEKEENYFMKLYSYYDCLYKDPYGALYNNSHCSEPSGQPDSNSDYTPEDFYKAYKRKMNSRYQDFRYEANSFLEMAIQSDPNQPKWLFEKAKISTNTSEKLSLLNKAVKLEPQNSNYQIELKKIQKKRYGELGEIGEKVNRKKHGKWVEYWSDGEVKQIVNYANGKITGDYLIFYDNDWKPTKKRSKYKYYRVKTYDKNGKISLEVKDFYKSGKPQKLGQYKDEAHTIKTGEFEKYYESGNLKSVHNYKNGKLQGIATDYTESGIVKTKMEYENGRLLNYLEIRDKKGNPIKSEDFHYGLARIKIDSIGKMGYINEDGFVVVPIVYDEIYRFIGEIAIVKKNNKYGGVNEIGIEVIPLESNRDLNELQEIVETAKQDLIIVKQEELDTIIFQLNEALEDLELDKGVEITQKGNVIASKFPEVNNLETYKTLEREVKTKRNERDELIEFANTYKTDIEKSYDNNQAAEQKIKKALKFDPTNGLYIKKLEEIDYIKKRKDFDLYYRKGGRFEIKNSYKLALREYQKALAIFPDDEKVKNQIEKVKQLLGEKKESKVEMIAKIQEEINAGNKTDEQFLSRIRSKIQRYITDYPDDVELLVAATTLYINEKLDINEALKMAEMAFKADPNNMKNLKNIGDIHFYNNNLKEAVENLKLAIDLPPPMQNDVIEKLTKAYYTLSLRSKSEDDQTEAIQYAQMGLENQLNHPIYQRVIKRFCPDNINCKK